MKRIIPIFAIMLLLTIGLASCSLFRKGDGGTESGGNGGKEETPACIHSWVTDAMVAPTCSETGLTEGKHCSLCGEVAEAQITINALGHTEAINEAKSATCTEDGITMGVYCSVCSTVIVEQEVIPAAHSYGEWENIFTADCFNDGEKKRSCTVCYEEETQTIAKLKHNFVLDSETSLEACSSCGAYTYGGHLYMVFEKNLTWNEAEAYCESLGGHLITITSEEEQNFITEVLKQCTNSYYWTGGFLNGSSWEWVTGEPFVYENWATGEPNNSGGVETKIHLYTKSTHRGKWNDTKNDNSSGNDPEWTAVHFSILCEWDAVE